MNLYIFNETRRGAVFGVGTYIRELTFALQNRSLHICIINLLSDKPYIQMEKIENIEHWYFPSPIPEQRTSDSQKQRALYFRNVVYLLQLHIKENESLVSELKEAFDCKIISVAHFSDWGFTVFDNLNRLRNILNEEHPDSFSENVKKSFEEERAYYTQVDHTICLSNYMKKILCQDYGLDSMKVSVVPNGLGDVVDMSVDKELLRKKWHVGPKEKIILFAGRIDEIKGVSSLIKAFHLVLEAYPNSRLLIAGNGDYTRAFQEAKNIYTKITFTGLLKKEELFEIYQLADAGVVPSLFEPFGYVPVEMMMHELPIIATTTSGLNEVVDESCGLKVPLIVSPDNVEIDTSLLAQKIVYLLQNPEEAKRLGKNGRKRYLEKYSSEVFGKNMIEFYKSLFQECK